MASDQDYDKRGVFAWCMYDFANSAFTTLVVTFVYSSYYMKAIAPNETIGTTMWSWGVSATAVCVALLSPILGAIADRGGNRKLFLGISTAICVAGCFVLFQFGKGDMWPALIVFVIANIAFEVGGVFYNAFLPDLAPSDKIGRISGYGWSLGYVGGLAALAIAYFALVSPETPAFGLDKDSALRAINVLVGLWFAVFSIPLFLWVKEDRSGAGETKGSVIVESFRQLKGTFAELKNYRQIMRFLLARLVFNDGLVTIFAFGGIFASGTFDFTPKDLLVFGAVLNVTAAAGAFGLGFLDDVLGGRTTILISIGALALAGTIGVMAPNAATFWVAGALIGIFSGPNQAASRSLLGRMVPPDKESEFFGFFAFSGKATAFMGPFMLGLITTLTGSQRAGFSVVILFFIVGGIMMWTVDEAEGIAASGRGKLNVKNAEA